MNPDSDKLQEEIMGWHKDFLQYYIKKEDAPIEFINRGIEILEQYRDMLLEREHPLSRTEKHFIYMLRVWEQDASQSSKADSGFNDISDEASRENAIANAELCQKVYQKLQKKFPNQLKTYELP